MNHFEIYVLSVAAANCNFVCSQFFTSQFNLLMEKCVIYEDSNDVCLKKHWFKVVSDAKSEIKAEDNKTALCTLPWKRYWAPLLEQPVHITFERKAIV